MNEIGESGCENCGGTLIRLATTPLEERADRGPMNNCDECGHYGPVRFSFYWPVELKNLVAVKWSGSALNPLRLDPESFVRDHLNPWLRERGEGEVEVYDPGMSRHLRWRRVP